MKKIICLLMCMILTVSVSITANALTEGDWEYKILDNEIYITRYNGDETDVIVPDTIRGLPVVNIKINDSGSTGKIKSIKLPDTVREIGEFAFYGSRNLEKIYLPKNLKAIKDKAFQECESLESIDLSGVSDIGSWVFWKCTSLTDVVLPKNLKEIPDGTFAFTNIKNIDIPGSVKKIGESAFGQSALETIIIPGSVETIGSSAFSGCINLKTVIISNGTKELLPNKTSDLKINGTFNNCTSLESVYIPESVTKLPRWFIYELDNAIVYCSENSYVAEFCKKNEISYIIDNSVNSKIHVMYNGSRVSFHKYNQNPEIINGRTMVPLRSIFETMGAKVEWDDKTQTVTASRGNINVSLKIGSAQMMVNGNTKILDVPATLINGRTMVPVRAVSEAFGCKVDWKDNSQTVIITQ